MARYFVKGEKRVVSLFTHSQDIWVFFEKNVK